LRAVSVHRDVLVITSRLWQTNAVALRSGDEAMLVDSPYFPDELEALPGLLASAGFEPDALLATHADYDHLLGRLAFPGLALGLGEPSVVRLHQEPGAAQRELRDKDDELYVERPAPLALGEVQTLPVPGSIELGTEELELHPAEGHTSDGMAVMARWCGLLCVGDYLSNVEIPMVEAGLADYRATLARLSPGATRPSGSSTRTWTTWTPSSEARRSPLCRRAAIRASSGRSTRRIWRAFNPGGPGEPGRRCCARH
jgi:glyoxylase-like metal-dependent hydrolase (beta-lactamase superfamily II)